MMYDVCKILSQIQGNGNKILLYNKILKQHCEELKLSLEHSHARVNQIEECNRKMEAELKQLKGVIVSINNREHLGHPLKRYGM